MRNAGQPGLLDHVMKATIPMRGRMIHGRTPLGELYEHAQDYDAKGRVSNMSKHLQQLLMSPTRLFLRLIGLASTSAFLTSWMLCQMSSFSSTISSQEPTSDHGKPGSRSVTRFRLRMDDRKRSRLILT